MAFLMLLHEKMRLQRKVNKLTLQQLKLSSRKERITKNISKVQKMYSSKMTQIEKYGQMMTSQFKNSILNQAGLGSQTIGFNPGYGYGLTGYVANAMGQMLANGGKPIKLSEGKSITGFEDGTLFTKMMNAYASNQLKPKYKVVDGKETTEVESYGDFSKDQYDCFMYAMTQAQQAQTQAQYSCQQMSSQYENNVSIWIEAQKAQLEEEQDAVLLPLEAEETDIELDNESCEAQLADAKARLESVKQACSEGIKDSAPTFGLG